jgi:hypothetical protein
MKARGGGGDGCGIDKIPATGMEGRGPGRPSEAAVLDATACRVRLPCGAALSRRDLWFRSYWVVDSTLPGLASIGLGQILLASDTDGPVAVLLVRRVPLWARARAWCGRAARWTGTG